jgi:hypothetical protein
MKKFTKNKKPIQFCIGFLFLMGFAQGQNLSHIQLLLQQKDFARARESVDSFVSIQPGDAEGWLIKSEVYTAISKDASAQSLVADAGMEAFQALQKAVRLDSVMVNHRLENEHFGLPMDLYNGFTNKGILLYNTATESNDKTSYANALANFKKAGLIGRFIYTNGGGLSAIDSLNLYYTSISAIKSDKEEDAEFYSKKIVDNNITVLPNQPGFENIYQWLVYYYKVKVDWENFDKYSNAGMNAFPASSYYILSYIDRFRQQKDYISLFAQYQMLFTKDDANSIYELAYYQDIYNYLYQSKPDTTIKRKQYYEALLLKGLTEYLQLNRSSTEARILLSKYYINQTAQQYRKMALLPATAAKQINMYRNKAAGQLKKANLFLLEIVNKFPADNRAAYKEALKLLIQNFRNLHMTKEARKYQLLLDKYFVTLYKIMILIYLLLNIILIIGFLVPSFYSSGGFY